MQKEKLANPGKLLKRAWTYTKMHISARTENQTWDSLVQREGRYAMLASIPKQ